MSHFVHSPTMPTPADFDIYRFYQCTKDWNGHFECERVTGPDYRLKVDSVLIPVNKYVPEPLDQGVLYSSLMPKSVTIKKSQ